MSKDKTVTPKKKSEPAHGARPAETASSGSSDHLYVAHEIHTLAQIVFWQLSQTLPARGAGMPLTSQPMPPPVTGGWPATTPTGMVARPFAPSPSPGAIYWYP